MDESALLAHIYKRAPGAADESIEVGPGDDCAVVDLGGPRHTLLTTDQLIEGRHFVPGTPAHHIAHKAIARSVSDIAACAGDPLCALVTAALPDSYSDDAARALFDAVHDAANNLGCPVVGGDIARAESNARGVHLTVTAVGVAHASRGAVLRSGARVGDAVFISGSLGGSFDLRTSEDGAPHHLCFPPRVALATELADTLAGDLRSMMDISDGLGVDAGRLALASGVAVELEQAAIPITPELGGAPDAMDRALSDGEDYELLFTTAPEAAAAIDGMGCTRVGTVVDGDSGAVRLIRLDGTRERVDGRGFVHRSDGRAI